MNRFIRFFNQNRWQLLITILIVVFIIALIYTINSILKSMQKEIEITNEVAIQDVSIPSSSVITGEELEEEITEENVNIIAEFVNFCNNQEYENAYNLLSQDCKDELYSTLDLFISNYYNNIFTTDITYSLELWYNTRNKYTYRIVYYENNILATGNINSSSNIEDYITIIDENGENKLNINNFIEKEEVNNSQTSEEAAITITVNDRYIYRTYEKYTITIKNDTDKTIMLSEGTNSNDICLVDTNEVEYDSMLNEVSLVSLELAPGIERTIETRFYKMYNLYRTIDYVSFKNIILDKEAYEQSEEGEEEIIIINIEV